METDPCCRTGFRGHGLCVLDPAEPAGRCSRAARGDYVPVQNYAEQNPRLGGGLGPELQMDPGHGRGTIAVGSRPEARSGGRGPHQPAAEHPRARARTVAAAGLAGGQQAPAVHPWVWAPPCRRTTGVGFKATPRCTASAVKRRENAGTLDQLEVRRPHTSTEILITQRV